MGRTLVSFILMLALLAVGAGKAVAAPSPPRVTADAAILIEARSAQVLYEKRGYQPRHPASMTKILTAIVALEQGDLQDRVTVSRRAAYVGGSTMRLKPGQEYRLEDLLSGLLLNSANDAAVAIAEHIGGSVEGFSILMNDKALDIGAFHTHFKNPHGLTRPGHLTTAYDVALMARYALEDPEFSRRVATKEKDIWRLDQDIQVRLRNTNRLLWSYLGADGVKTGTTAAAGKCLVASASRGDMQLIVVVMHSDRRWEDAADLLEWGFDNFETSEPLNQGQTVGWTGVKRGMIPHVPVVLEWDLMTIYEKGESSEFEVRSRIIPEVEAPVRKGDPLGEVYLIRDGEIEASSLLVAGKDVPRRTPFGLFLRAFLPVFRGFVDYGLR